jgi:hypothetical protein
MKQYGCLQAIYMSFYSRALYRDIAKNWGAGVMLYLFMLLTICWTCLMFRIQPTINSSATHFANAVIPQLPQKIVIKNGIVSTPEDRPYFVRNLDTKETIAIIDTTGKYTTLEEANTSFLMTKDSMIYADKSAVKIQKLPTDLNINIDPIVVKGFTIKFIGWLWVILFPVLLLCSFVYRILQSLFYAVLGKLFAILSKTSILYFDILKLTMVAITPAIVISTIVDFFNVWPHGHLLFYFVLSMGYLIFAIYANKPR